MKGIILAGGVGSRLQPVTYLLNKNLLPVYNKPGIFYSIEMFAKAGIKDICIVAEYRYIDDFTHLLGNGTDFGVNISYQNDTPMKKGPASAVYYAKNFADGDNVTIIFADNNFDMCLKKEVESFKSGAHIFVKEVPNPKQFGVVQLDDKGRVSSIEEKPENPKSNLVVTGLGIYDNTVFDKIERIKPGAKGEYYMVDVYELYIKEKALEATNVKGPWQDIGTFDGILKASNYWYEKVNGETDYDDQE